MSVNSRIKVIKVIGQRKTIYRQRVPGSSYARKETVDRDIFVTSSNGNRKIMQSIRITSRSTLRIRMWNQLSQFRWKSTKVITTEKTYAGNISTVSQGFKRGSKWRTNSPAYLFLWLIQQFQVATRSTSQDITTVFHTWKYGRFIEIQSNLTRKKLQRINPGSNFLGGSFSNRDNVRAPIQFRKESKLQHHKRWFFLKNRPIYFHIDSTRVIRPVKLN